MRLGPSQDTSGNATTDVYLQIDEHGTIDLPATCDRFIDEKIDLVQFSLLDGRL